MQYDELLKAVLEDRPFKNIKRLAIEKFGEENVDFQLPRDAHPENRINLHDYYDYLLRQDDSYPAFKVIIYFPKKTVTCNETGKTHDIEEVYCNLSIFRDEKFNISTARAKYTTAEINSDYTHSHVSGVSTSLYPWKNTCLGRENSPLNLLKNKRNKDDLDWINVFNEIDRFYEVESLTGIPYRRLDNITEYKYSHFRSTRFVFPTTKLNRLDTDFSDFVVFVRKKIKQYPKMISNVDGEFIITDSVYELKLKLTNWIVEYLDIIHRDSPESYKAEEKKFNKILETNIKNPIGEFTTCTTRNSMLYREELLFKFKGKDVRRKVINSRKEQYYLMPSNVFILYVFLKLSIMLNYERFKEPNSTETVKIVL